MRQVSDFKKLLDGYRLVTAEILYRMPDHPKLLQSYIWQDFDMAPKYPVLGKFLDFAVFFVSLDNERAVFVGNVLMKFGYFLDDLGCIEFTVNNDGCIAPSFVLTFDQFDRSRIVSRAFPFFFPFRVNLQGKNQGNQNEDTNNGSYNILKGKETYLRITVAATSSHMKNLWKQVMGT